MRHTGTWQHEICRRAYANSFIFFPPGFFCALHSQVRKDCERAAATMRAINYGRDRHTAPNPRHSHRDLGQGLNRIRDATIRSENRFAQPQTKVRRNEIAERAMRNCLIIFIYI